jgi:hypothetical protein
MPYQTLSPPHLNYTVRVALPPLRAPPVAASTGMEGGFGRSPLQTAAATEFVAGGTAVTPKGQKMSFDDLWYGMRRHRGERGVFIPGEGFRAAPLPPWVPPPVEAPAQPPMPVAQPEPVVPVEAPEGDLPPLKPPPKHARDYLQRRLSGRVEVPAAVLFKDAANYGFSTKMLRTAKNGLKIRVFQQGRAWWWLLTEVT